MTIYTFCYTNGLQSNCAVWKKTDSAALFHRSSFIGIIGN